MIADVRKITGAELDKSQGEGLENLYFVSKNFENFY